MFPCSYFTIAPAAVFLQTCAVMTRSLALASIAVLALTAACGGDSSNPDDPDGGNNPRADANPNLPEGVVFDHRHADLGAIPGDCLAHLKDGSFVFHYAHRSHGSQIIVGADAIEADMPTYGFEASWCSVPDETDVFKMWDGMVADNLVYADQYWATDAGLTALRGILTANPSITYSMWAWSFEINEETQQSIQEYLDVISALEVEFPNVTFVYMTGPAQGEYMAVNRFERNKQIRDFAVANGKVLYDFEDLEAWYDGDYYTVTIDGTTMPMEHPHYSLDTNGNTEYEYSHTTQDSCEHKARAFWGMMAVLEDCAN